jgi:hypothetical protein
MNIRDDVHALLGKRVRVKLDEKVVQEGKLLGWGEGGDFEIEQDDGFVYHCWPMLSIEEAEVPEFREEDLHIEIFRDGLENVSVKITHLPTGLKVIASDRAGSGYRTRPSSLRAKELALSRLRADLRRKSADDRI